MHTKNSRKKGGKRRKQRTAFPKAQRFSPARSMPLIAPDQFDTRLRFRFLGPLTGTGQVVKKFTPNAAYDVDPSVGSTETYGFDEYAALYSYYRVISYKYRMDIDNVNTTSTASCYVLNTNTNPSDSGTRFDLYATNPYCQSFLLNAFPGAKCSHTFRGAHQVSKILGAPVVETDDNYRALTTANPADLIWLTFAAESLATSGSDGNVNLGVVIDVEMSVRFYGREVDLTLAGMEKRIQLLKKAKQQHLLQKQCQ